MTPTTSSLLRRLRSWLPFGWVRHIPREINPVPGAPTRYLDRYSLRRQLPSGQNAWRVYLHRFHAPDSEGHHNHPCTWGFGIVLWGSYTEEVLVRPQDDYGQQMYDADYRQDGAVVLRRRIRWFNWVPASKYHRIVELHPRRPGGAVWTLFVMGPLARDRATGKLASWGFYEAGRGHVDHVVREAERAFEAAQAKVFHEHGPLLSALHD